MLHSNGASDEVYEVIGRILTAEQGVWSGSRVNLRFQVLDDGYVLVGGGQPAAVTRRQDNEV